MGDNDFYLYAIVALLPLAASLLVFQTNPYHALVIRGVLGAVAAMVDAVLGAADVALTEALVGTMLAITLYAVAVRSSLVLRLGLLEHEFLSLDKNSHLGQLVQDLRGIFSKHFMRLELIPYTNREALEQALKEREVHAICVEAEPQQQHPYHTKTRVQRLYEIMQGELGSPRTALSYESIANSGGKA